MDGSEAELTYSIASPVLIIADHTGAPDELRGRGLAQALAARLVADALEGEYKIVPLCPFVASEKRNHPEWAAAFQ
ncbi:N-acetyltransferase [Algicella marina]|uniref:N-acetyltransferase n=2 Tax=Algicella marina TaxID=2683284 RepID=A0A6P1T2S1_9RHOB|nr:GNAT family N-acetyltransferase [Algicella marina]QHQ37234.1 N-acetyltransferase [Algicella marina]